jgi:hypothetical protein
MFMEMETVPQTLSVRPEFARLRSSRKNDNRPGACALESGLPGWLVIRLNNPLRRPRRGIHFWLYHVARHLPWHFGEEQIFTLLWARTRQLGRVVTEKEIRNEIASAKATAWRPPERRSL